MALSANTALTFIRGEQSEAPVKGSTTVYEGAMLGETSGYVRGLVAGDLFRGHATEYVDNSSGSDGDLTVKRMCGRYRLEVTLSSVALTNVGDQVYASADDTLTLTPGSNTRVGVVDRYVTTDTAIVEFQTNEVAAIASDLTALLSDLALNSYSDFNTYVSDVTTNKSDIVVIASDITANDSDVTSLRSDVTILESDRTTAESDITVLESDRTTAASDITILESDSTTVQSDIVVIKSDITANDSDIVVIKSDITVGGSDTTVHISDVRVAISDALLAHTAGDWANVSDIKVSVAEIIAAFSDALG